MTEQTEGAEVEALAREMFDLSGTPENWWADHRKGFEQHAREIIRSDWLAAREAAAEARGAQAVLAAVEEVAKQWDPSPLSVAAEIVDAARAAAAVTTSFAKSSDLATRVPRDESQRAAGGGA